MKDWRSFPHKFVSNLSINLSMTMIYAWLDDAQVKDWRSEILLHNVASKLNITLSLTSAYAYAQDSGGLTQPFLSEGSDLFFSPNV